MVELVWLIPTLPLGGFLFLLLAGSRLGEPKAGWLATAASACSFVVTFVVFLGLLTRTGDDRSFEQVLFDWLPVGSLNVEAGFLVDALSMTMALFVTGVGTLIHLYSVGYMHGDQSSRSSFCISTCFYSQC